MIENNVKIPQIIALILEGFSLAAAILSVLSQDSIMNAYNGSTQLTGQHVVPVTVYIISAAFIVQLVFFIASLSYKGQSRRLIAGITAAVYVVINISSQWLNLLVNVAMARQGSAKLAAYATLSSSISNTTGAFIAVSSALFFIALGRYGLSKNPEDINPLYYQA
ncbi:MAG: hypothetical protein IKR23_09900 [Lachnospiraceae bacterium]|nr:hypothetical protein [Lachnospiraceae bacterium]